MTHDHRSIAIRGLALALILSAAGMHAACAVTTDEARGLRAKAALAQQQLKTAIDNRQDVSEIVPMMKKVKQLADQGRIKEADLLLDKILAEFERLDDPAHASRHAPATSQGFINPREVTIRGYHGNVMEAFISRDGKYLFFNSDKSDTPKTGKNLFYAERLDDTTFTFIGAIEGVNSAEVDGVPTMDIHGNFYFVSTAHYGRENGYATIYGGRFKNGRVDRIRSHPELSLNRPGWLNMDIEISADGKTMYATQTYFGSGHPPQKSIFFIARRKGDRFVVDTHSDKLLKHINTDDLEYAASVSSDEREFFFTRSRLVNGVRFASYRATRTARDVPFSVPVRIEAISGIAEAPAISADGQSLYFHKKVDGLFVLFKLERVTN